MTAERGAGGLHDLIYYQHDKLIRWDYSGGAYIDLTFGSSYYKPTEVINVWDDDTDKPDIPFSRTAVTETVTAWMANMDKEWPDWFIGYLANA